MCLQTFWLNWTTCFLMQKWESKSHLVHMQRGRNVKYGPMKPPRYILLRLRICVRTGLATSEARNFILKLILIVGAAPLTCHASIAAVPTGGVRRGRTPRALAPACTRGDESVTGFTGASALHHGKGQPCCLLVCLQCCTGGLIWGVDRSCNLKRGHCSSEQKQLKENERRPPRVKNRKLSTCTLESAALLAVHATPCTSSPPSPPRLTGPALLCMIRSASSSSKLLVTFWLNEVQLRRELGSSC